LIDLLAASNSYRIKYLLLIGAYRENEVDETHPLTQTLHEIKRKGGVVQDILLNPLSEDNIVDLLEDTFNNRNSSTTPSPLLST
jgi:predicted ATPase